MRKILTLSSVIGLIALAFLFLQLPVTLVAQGGTLLWVRFYQDANENAMLDANEGLITSGVAVQLLNQDGVVVASALLDDVPTASQGLIGFQDIVPGDYVVLITSAEYAPTGDTEFDRTILAGGVPVLVEYGAVPVNVASENAAPARRGLFGLPIYLGDPEQVARVAVSLLIGLLVAMVMTALGIVIYVFMRRRYLRRLRDLKRQAATSGEISRVNIPPGTVF